MAKKKVPIVFSFFRQVVLDKKILLSILSSVFFVVAPFLNWLSWSLSYDKVLEKESFNLFELAGEGLDINISIFYAICFFLVALLFVAVEFMDFAYNLRGKKPWIQYIEYIILLLVILMVVATVNDERIVSYISYKDGEIEALKYWIEGVKGFCNRGIGPVFAIVGILLALVSRFGELVYILFAKLTGGLKR